MDIKFRNILTFCDAELLAPHLTLPSWRITLCHPSPTWARTMPCFWVTAWNGELQVMSIWLCCQVFTAAGMWRRVTALYVQASGSNVVSLSSMAVLEDEGATFLRNVGTQWRSTVLQRPQTSKPNKFNLCRFNMHHYGCHAVMQCICQERGPETTQLSLSVWPNCNGILLEHF